MDRLTAIETFVRIVDAGSLSAAARESGRSLASVVRMLAALESHLGVRLLARTTRKLHLTEEGAAYLVRAREVLRLVEEAEAAAADQGQRPVGCLQVSAPLMFGRLHVAPVLLALQAREPALAVSLRLTDRQIDLLDEGTDVAVRIGLLADSSLRAIEVGRTRRLRCASPDYLARYGTPSRAEDLATHARIGFLSPAAGWDTLEPGAPAPLPGRFDCNSMDVVVEAALSGRGIATVLSYQVAEHLARGALVELLPELAPPPVPISVVYPHARLLPAKVRAFRDAMKAQGAAFDFS